ncbi:hypothetical protein DSO57_1031256 [Entomophthora muscae]|uniref:Uncharacterized protein n=1 Tax=Entomophthora muscae TaxID=34485 RepID=A0ACC2SPR9_9FUNG|nr:hypothetical protein DSO57_1031256 [Entomophthora muscae]
MELWTWYVLTSANLGNPVLRCRATRTRGAQPESFEGIPQLHPIPNARWGRSTLGVSFPITTYQTIDTIFHPGLNPLYRVKEMFFEHHFLDLIQSCWPP